MTATPRRSILHAATPSQMPCNANIDLSCLGNKIKPLRRRQDPIVHPWRSGVWVVLARALDDALVLARQPVICSRKSLARRRVEGCSRLTLSLVAFAGDIFVSTSTPFFLRFGTPLINCGPIFPCFCKWKCWKWLNFGQILIF